MEQDQNESLFELQVDYDSANSFREVTRWTKFIAIVYFIAIGFGLLALAFASTTIINAFGTLVPEFVGVGSILIALVVVVIGVYITIALFLYRFATLTRQGIERQDQHTFAEGLKALKNYFLVTGVVALLSLVLRFLGLVTNLFGPSF